MAHLTARAAALGALQVWRNEPGPADVLFAAAIANRSLSAADRAFALELFYGVLRNITLLDFWISCLRRSGVAASLRDLARLGLYQLLLLDVAEHAAVYETVELAPSRHRGIINAILRTAARQREHLLSKASLQPLSVRASHPEFLIQRWTQNFGERAAAEMCRWDNQPAPVYARINTLKIDDEKFARIYPDAAGFAGHPTFFRFPKFPGLALQRGHCYIQDPSTRLACDLLDPRPGDRLLDACAAPGGKTALLAQIVKNQASIVACDRDEDRISRMIQNFRRLTVEVSSVYRCDWIHNPPSDLMRLKKSFDRILVDAPCTNTGVMRRRVDLRWRLRAGDFEQMATQQRAIARRILPLLKPGGVLVYSTCSLEPEENQGVVEHLLGEFAGLQLVEQRESMPFRDNIDGAFAAKLVTNKTGQSLHRIAAMES